MDAVASRGSEDDAPDQIAYGTSFFAGRGYDPRPLPARRRQYLYRALRRLRPAILRSYALLLARQIEDAAALFRADVVYSPRGPQALLVASLLRRLRLLDTPLVCLVHQAPGMTLDAARSPSALFRQVMKGCDALPALSELIAGDVRPLARRAGLSPSLAFGPDAGWYPEPEIPGDGVIAVGMAGRDFITLGRGAARTGVSTQIVCPTAMAGRLPPLGDNVRVVHSEHDEWLPYRQVMSLCAGARVNAIPLVAHGRLYGLNSLADALALGKPVLMTRIPEIDLDIEGEGVGRWVAPGDVAGWQRGIDFFDRHPDDAVAMGRRARALVDAGLNSEAFARVITDIFDAVLGDEHPYESDTASDSVRSWAE